MSKRSNLVYLLVALVLVFTSIAAGAFAAVEMVAVQLDSNGVVFHVGDSLDGPAQSLAGICDMNGACGGGSGKVGK